MTKIIKGVLLFPVRVILIFPICVIAMAVQLLGFGSADKMLDWVFNAPK